MELHEALQAKFKKAFETYSSIANEKDGTPILCKIHDAFGGNEGPSHNCLGCNLANSQTMIYNFLSKHETYEDVEESISLYIIALYLLVERMETIMGMVQLPDAFRDKHFKVFQQIHKWANFIKHPKSFILTHHATYDYENSGFHGGREFSVIINDSFVETYYKGEREPDKQKAKNKELYKKLKNKMDVQVVFPDIEHLTSKICYSIKAFVDLITKNQVYIDILNDEATIAVYFEYQSEHES